MKRKNRYFILFSAFILISASTAFAQVKNSSSQPLRLTQKEKVWLANHKELRIAPDPDFPPVEWIGKDGEFQGLAADFVRLVEKQLGIQFKPVKPDTIPTCHLHPGKTGLN